MPDLLPWHATPFEKAFSRAADPAVRLDTPITISRGIKYIGTPPSWLPFLIHEYGLGELSPYVPNLYRLIDDGIRWQRVRGTPAAISTIEGDAAAIPDGLCIVEGARPGIDGPYRIESVTHSYSRGGGFVTELSLRQPGSGGAGGI